MTYAERKAKARQEAIEWQAHFDCMDWYSVNAWTVHFAKMAKRYGLVKEFKENGII